VDFQFPQLVDTHAHLADPLFDVDREEVLERATRVGIGAILVMGEDGEDNERVLQVCRAHSGILRPCLGLYPGNADLDAALQVAQRVRQEGKSLGAIGEVGLDFRLAESPSERAVQEEVLGLFVHLSKEVDLPLSVHSRSAGRKCIQLLLRNQAVKVVMHAFDGKAGHAMEACEAGYYFSIPPSLVRARQKEKLVKLLPLDRLLLESDAPVLGPVREKRNEPARISVSLDRIAEIKGIDPLQVAQATTANALDVFGSHLIGER